MAKVLTEEQKQQRAVERITVENEKLRAFNKSLLRAGGFAYEEVLEDIKEVLKFEKKFKFKPTIIKNRQQYSVNKEHSEIACLALSDIHLSEVVNSNDVNGANKVNSIIVSNRLWNVIFDAKKVITLHKLMYNFDKLWIALLGDNISGSIHNDLALTNDLSDSHAALLVSRLLYIALQELKTLGIPIEIDCVVGNHTRSTQKMFSKIQAHNNYDNLIYEILADRFIGDPQIKINVHSGQTKQINLYDWKYLIEHGIGVTSGKEEALEDDLRAIYDDRQYRTANGNLGTAYDMLVIGHLHQMKSFPKMFINGSLNGITELTTTNKYRPIPAGQWLWGVSRKHVRTWSYNIDVTSVISEKADNPMSNYTIKFLEQYGR